MIKKAVIITSLIDVDNHSPLTYSDTRSFFNSQERLRQTVFTVASLNCFSDPDVTIFLLDSSENCAQYREFFLYQKNLVYISVKEIFPEFYQEIRTHPNKSRGECLMLSLFMEKFRNILQAYDYILKISGRYFIDHSCNFFQLTTENIDKIFFKHSWKWDWQDRWGYEKVDMRSFQKNNLLHQYATSIYGWGSKCYDVVLSILKMIAEFLKDPANFHYDVETLIHFYTRPYEKDIIEVDWKIYGWKGASGEFYWT